MNLNLLTVADKADIRNAREIIRHIMGIVSAWEQYAQDVGVMPEYVRQIKKTVRILKCSY